MAAKVGDVVYKVGEGVDLEELWDDSALIKAYDKAVNSFKYGSSTDPVESPSSKKKNRRKKRKNKRQSNDSCDEFEENPAASTNWALGDKCQAIFSEDGVLYNAEIIDIYKSPTNTCVVRYTDYGNEEEQYLTDLIPLPETTLDDDVDIEQNTVQNGEYTSETSKPSHEWQISDICIAPELPHYHLHEAVINYFPSKFTCKVTFIRSRKSQEVNIEDIQRADYHKHNHGQNYIPANAHVNPLFPPMYPYSLAYMGSHPYYPFTTPQHPTPPFDRRWPPGRNPKETVYSKGVPRPPVPPPPPPMSLDALHSDDESLASMLMSWYLSGYHTGYFKAAQQFRSGSSNAAKSKTNNECEPPTMKQSPKETEMDTKE